MRIILTLLALAAFMPLPANAYLTPEEVLEEEDLVAPPPNARNAAAARAAQEAEYDARAAEEAADDEAAVDETATDDGLHGAADEEEVIDWEEDEPTPDERHDARVLERVERNRLDDQGVVLHGGAPPEFASKGKGKGLAPTGTGTVLAVLLGLGAVGYTLRKALKA